MINVYFSPVMDPRPEYLVSGSGVPMLPSPDVSTFFLARNLIILSGLYYIFYTITDRAGNVSRPSFNDFRTVSLLDDPQPLEPFLPLAPAPRAGSTDDLLDIQDYRQGLKPTLKIILTTPLAWTSSRCNGKHSPLGRKPLSWLIFRWSSAT
ncbi:hypothetical protein KFQ04_20060 [Pseudomonas synxantha]|nr:hypothetical protein KFQ04_20060 [Pseudomonas synxantha]